MYFLREIWIQYSTFRLYTPKSVVKYSFCRSNLNTVRHFLHTNQRKYCKVFKFEVRFEYSTTFFAYESPKVSHCIFLNEIYNFCNKIQIQYDTFGDTYATNHARYSFSTSILNTVRHFWVHLCKKRGTVFKIYIENSYLTCFFCFVVFWDHFAAARAP